MNLPLHRIHVLVGDITQLNVQAIVNAANESLLGGGGVDGAIHRAAGPQLKAHNQTLGGCTTGLARITPAFNLASRGIRHIIHTVGPVWHGDDAQKLGNNREDVLLASCYQQTLTLAAEHDIQTLAFAAISTGIYSFPKPRAARIALGHVLGWLARNDRPHEVTFCCFSDEDAAVYHDAIATHDNWMFNRKRG